MCGLAGIFNLDGASINSQDLLKMTRIIRHRGPDDEGYLLIHTANKNIHHHVHDDTISEIKANSSVLPNHTNCNLGIGYRRLAIIDLSAKGHQPMADPSGQIWLSFNGEIYNYIEIREELIKLGHQFRTNSDSEVLIHAYLQWNEQCLGKFIGMFAFVIYDNRSSSLFIARDRMGIKPFNYFFDGNQFIWASEEKQIAAIIPNKISPNRQALLEFLQWNRQFETSATFITEIQQLPAAHYAIVSLKGIELKKYWDIPLASEREMLNESDSCNSIQALLSDSIKLRLRSDVPLGIALSGGIDSSSICCLARKLTNQSIRTFSVFYEGKQYDERSYIQAVLDQGGFQSTFQTGSKEITVEELTAWTYHQDAPTAGGSPFSAFLNYRNVRQAGIIVLLNGQGGDELFAGYPYFYKYYLAQCYQQGNIMEILKTTAALAFQQGFKTAISHNYLAKQRLQLDSVALRKLEHKKYASSNLYPETQMQINLHTNHSFLSTALQNAIQITHLPHMLHWEDRNSMANSIESRVPFLDHRLVEKSFYIPDHLKLHQGETKYILRESMKPYVPEIILKRKDKIGFATPTSYWTHTVLKSAIMDMVHSSDFLSRDWWHGKQIQDRITKDINQFGENELWKIFTSELWYQSTFQTNP